MNITRQGSTLCISDIPELGAASPQLFGPVLTQLVCGEIRQVEIDLTGAEFIDCAGAGALLSFHHSARRKSPGAEFRVISSRAAVKRLFTLLGLDRVFTVSGWRSSGLPTACAKPEAAPCSAAAFDSPATLPLLEVSAAPEGMNWVKNPMV